MVDIYMIVLALTNHILYKFWKKVDTLLSMLITVRAIMVYLEKTKMNTVKAMVYLEMVFYIFSPLANMWYIKGWCNPGMWLLRHLAFRARRAFRTTGILWDLTHKCSIIKLDLNQVRQLQETPTELLHYQVAVEVLTIHFLIDFAKNCHSFWPVVHIPQSF